MTENLKPYLDAVDREVERVADAAGVNPALFQGTPAVGTVWVDRMPAVSGPHRDLFRRLVRVDAVSASFVCGLSYWEKRGTDPRDREWHRDTSSRGRPTRIGRQAFERKFELLDDGRTPEEMLREQIARDILDYAENHEHSTADAYDAFNVAAHIARGEDPHCDCMDAGYAEPAAGVI